MNVSQKYLNESSNYNYWKHQAVAKSSSFSYSTGHFYRVFVSPMFGGRVSNTAAPCLSSSSIPHYILEVYRLDKQNSTKNDGSKERGFVVDHHWQS